LHPTAIVASRVQGFGKVTTGLAYESIHVLTKVHSPHQGWDGQSLRKSGPHPLKHLFATPDKLAGFDLSSHQWAATSHRVRI
jgi:hypothetical protein